MDLLSEQTWPWLAEECCHVCCCLSFIEIIDLPLPVLLQRSDPPAGIISTVLARPLLCKSLVSVSATMSRRGVRLSGAFITIRMLACVLQNVPSHLSYGKAFCSECIAAAVFTLATRWGSFLLPSGPHPHSRPSSVCLTLLLMRALPAQTSFHRG